MKIPVRLRIIIASILLLILAQLFSASLNISSFEKLYRNSLVSSYQVLARDLQRNINSAIRFGKPLEKFIGIRPLMEELQKNNPELSNILVTNTEGRILYSIQQEMEGTTAGSDLQINFGDKKNSQTQDGQVILSEGSYCILLPALDRKEAWAGTANLCFQEEVIQNKVNRLVVWSLQILGISTLVAAGILALCLNFFVSFRVGNKVPKAKIYLFLLSILGGSLVFYSAINVPIFQNHYLEVIHNKSKTLTKLLQDDIEFLLNKGIRIDRLFKVDILMSEIIQVTPEIKDMRILDKDHDLLYFANKDGVVNIQKAGKLEEQEEISGEDEDQEYEIIVPLHKKEALEGYIKVELSPKVIQNKIEEVILDSLTVVVVSLLFIVELVIVFLIFIGRQMKPRQDLINKDATPPYGLIRPAAFILLFAIALTVSFLPLHMADLYEPIFGLSKDVVTGLPISIEMLFTLIVLFPCANWMGKKGWHQPFLLGSLIAGIAIGLSGLATGPIEFLIYRGILGVGYGMAWLSIQGFVIANTGVTDRAKGISNLVAGIFSGSICGSAVGAMLAERIGYVPVFFVASGLMLLPILFALIFLRDFFVTPPPPQKQEEAPSVSLLKFFMDRNVFATFTFSIVPTSVCLIGILYYMSPVYLNRIGVSQSNIGRAFMTFGLCMIYIAPFISRFVDRSSNKKIFIIISGVCGSLGLGIFFIYEGFLATVMMILMLGLASSFGSASQMVYVLNLKITHEVGLAKVMSAQRTADKLGQMLGPIILGSVVGIVGVDKGITLISVIYFGATIFFLIGARQQKTIQLPG
ncbi:MAG: MFS transporter [SAR324 cluster bacterium]|nr:MFS transporter [SAR324 cluster bacterium]